MKNSNLITFCISTYNNLNYLKLVIDSVRKNSYYKESPFIIHAENCIDGTNEWLEENKIKLEQILDKTNTNILYNLPRKLSQNTKEKCSISGCWLFIYNNDELLKIMTK